MRRRDLSRLEDAVARHRRRAEHRTTAVSQEAIDALEAFLAQERIQRAIADALADLSKLSTADLDIDPSWSPERIQMEELFLNRRRAIKQAHEALQEASSGDV